MRSKVAALVAAVLLGTALTACEGTAQACPQGQEWRGNYEYFYGYNYSTGKYGFHWGMNYKCRDI